MWMVMLGLLACGGTPEAPPTPPEPVAVKAPLKPAKPQITQEVKATFLDLPAERPIDRKVLPRLIKPLDGTEARDIAPEAPEKVDLFQPEGASQVTRAEFDLDRDGTVDEIWYRSGKGVRRSFHPDANGTMQVHEIWKDRRWRDDPKGGQ